MRFRKRDELLLGYEIEDHSSDVTWNLTRGEQNAILISSERERFLPEIEADSYMDLAANHLGTFEWVARAAYECVDDGGVGREVFGRTCECGRSTTCTGVGGDSCCSECTVKDERIAALERESAARRVGLLEWRERARDLETMVRHIEFGEESATAQAKPKTDSVTVYCQNDEDL